ncbi:uncharacterized protein K441DRAFT_589268, partial [Cenococcum geophilum 1.58]
INSILGEHLNKFIIVYLNNIIIYLITKEEYREYLIVFITRFRLYKILININKSKFYATKIKYLSLIILTNSITIDPKKV